MITKPQARRLRRVGGAVTLSLLVGYSLLLLAVRVHESTVRLRSEAIYAEFLKLQPGRTTKSEVELLGKRGANSLTQVVHCKGVDCEYTIGDVWHTSRWYLISWLAHDHQPASELILHTRGDVLSSASFWIRVLVPKGYGTREERKLQGVSHYVQSSSSEYMLLGRASLVTDLPDAPIDSTQDYRITKPAGLWGGLMIWVDALPSVIPVRRAQILQIGFDCMTRWSVCTDTEDVMPIAAER
jgi:hypothetical protein